MKKTIVQSCLAALISVFVVSCERASDYRYDVEGARAVNLLSGETFFHEFGDPAGPFKSVGGSQGNPGQSVTFTTWVNGEQVEWKSPAEEDVLFVSEKFVNIQGNEFVVVHRKRDAED